MGPEARFWNCGIDGLASDNILFRRPFGWGFPVAVGAFLFAAPAFGGFE